MSGFSSAQLKKLTSKLDRVHVQRRTVEGKSIDYIEGWFALSEANAIFGFSNWDRETVHFERLFERTRGEMTTCSYSARVRVRVRAGDQTISREGTGCGTASARAAADAHERAIKAAETDATKRALATFGNRFGLCLYDKEQAGVSEPNSRFFEILCPDGQVFAASLSPESFCTALRKIIETAADQTELSAWQERNAPHIARLRTLAPDLKTQRGEHYADVLDRLFAARLAATAGLSVSGTPKAEPASGAAAIGTRESNLAVPQRGSGVLAAMPVAATEALAAAVRVGIAPNGDHPNDRHGTEPSETDSRSKLAGQPAAVVVQASSTADTCNNEHGSLGPSRIALGPRIDKTALAFKTARRLRDKAHLRHVATLPCLICGRQPSHAHHVRYAQPHGLSQKVSDEFVVPLCFLHHRALHDAGSERDWWRTHGLDPLPISARMWAESHVGSSGDGRQSVSENPTAASALP